jgi:hypothetical protein
MYCQRSWRCPGLLHTLLRITAGCKLGAQSHGLNFRAAGLVETQPATISRVWGTHKPAPNGAPKRALALQGFPQALSQARPKGRVSPTSPTPQVEAATPQVQRQKWNLLMSGFRRRTPCFTVAQVQRLRSFFKHFYCVPFRISVTDPWQFFFNLDPNATTFIIPAKVSLHACADSGMVLAPQLASWVQSCPRCFSITSVSHKPSGSQMYSGFSLPVTSWVLFRLSS